jgi:hypothetical protein
VDDERSSRETPTSDAAPVQHPADSERLDADRSSVDYDEAQRANRRRLALIGIATGAVMALLVLLCILLLLLLVP